MADRRLRAQIAFEAARLMYSRSETEYFTAKRKAAKRLARGQIKPSDLPSNAEIRDLIQSFARLYEGEQRTENLREMRLGALQMMRLLRRYRPRLIGSVMTGHVRAGSDIDIHVFCDCVEALSSLLDSEGYHYDIERKQVVKHNEARVFTHIHVRDTFNFELTVYAEDKAHFVFKSSITGKAIERASIAELEQLIEREYPEIDLDTLGEEPEIADDETIADPYQLFALFLEPLAKVKQGPKHHPEGDVLYHLLQVFELAKAARPYDEEFLQAALLHDIGKGVDPQDHVNGALEILDGLITERTHFLIENHMLALEYKAGTLGHRARIRLEASPDFDDLMLLRELDSAGRVPGAPVGTIEEAIEYLRELSAANEGWDDDDLDDPDTEKPLGEITERSPGT